MIRFGLAAGLAAFMPSFVQAQDAQLTDLDAGALYALSSVAGARPNCSTLIAGDSGASGLSPEERWLAWDEDTQQWRLVRSSMEPDEASGAPVNSLENALALFIVCGVAPRSDGDLTRLTDAIQDASSRWEQGVPD